MNYAYLDFYMWAHNFWPFFLLCAPLKIYTVIKLIIMYVLKQTYNIYSGKSHLLCIEQRTKSTH